MSRWFRFYDDAINDPKVLKLSDGLYRVWIGLLCVASKNEGKLPPLGDIALMIRMKPEKARAAIEKLITAGLIDETEGDSLEALSPHNWNARQYKSDVSTDRVKRFRNGHATAVETPPDTDTEPKKKEDIRAVETTRPKPDGSFEVFWKAYPRRAGANPKSPAWKVFRTFVASGVEPQSIIDGAKRCAEVEHGKLNTEFIPQAVKWLRDRRWEDYLAEDVQPQTNAPAGFYAVDGSPELDAWDQYWRVKRGMNAMRDKRGGWLFDTQWPPGHQEERAA